MKTPKLLAAATVVTLVVQIGALMVGGPASAASLGVVPSDQPIGTNRLVDVRPDGESARQNGFEGPISGDGRYVVFESSDPNLIAGRVIKSEQLYVHDRVTNLNRLVTHAPNGTPGNQSEVQVIEASAISADGQLIVFVSNATNLSRDDTDTGDDIFLYNQATDSITLVSRDTDGRDDYSDSEYPDISSDGTTIVFNSEAYDLISGEEIKGTHVYRYAVGTGLSQVVDRNPQGDPADGDGFAATVSGDGTKITYGSDADDLISGITSGYDEYIVLYDSVAGTTTLASRTPDGSQPDGHSDASSISSDGTKIAYTSDANDIDGPTGYVREWYLFDIASGTSTMITRGLHGLPGQQAKADSGRTFFSADGNLVAYPSSDPNLVRHDTNDSVDVFVYNVTTATNERVDLSFRGKQLPIGAFGGNLSADGSLVVFATQSDKVVRHPAPNGHTFVRRLA